MFQIGSFAADGLLDQEQLSAAPVIIIKGCQACQFLFSLCWMLDDQKKCVRYAEDRWECKPCLPEARPSRQPAKDLPDLSATTQWNTDQWARWEASVTNQITEKNPQSPNSSPLINLTFGSHSFDAMIAISKHSKKCVRSPEDSHDVTYLRLAKQQMIVKIQNIISRILTFKTCS